MQLPAPISGRLWVDTEDVNAVVRSLMDGLGRAAAAFREPTFKVLVEPGTSEIDLAESARRFKEMVEALLMLQLRHMFETEGITAVERATGKLLGTRHVAVAFADLTGFTCLGEVLVPNDLERVARRLGDPQERARAHGVPYKLLFDDSETPLVRRATCARHRAVQQSLVAPEACW